MLLCIHMKEIKKKKSKLEIEFEAEMSAMDIYIPTFQGNQITQQENKEWV